MNECNKAALVYTKNKLSWIFIFNVITRFFPSNFRLYESMEHDISHTPWWDRYWWIPLFEVSFITMYRSITLFTHDVCLLTRNKYRRVYISLINGFKYIFCCFYSFQITCSFSLYYQKETIERWCLCSFW